MLYRRLVSILGTLMIYCLSAYYDGRFIWGGSSRVNRSLNAVCALDFDDLESKLYCGGAHKRSGISSQEVYAPNDSMKWAPFFSADRCVSDDISSDYFSGCLKRRPLSRYRSHEA